MLRKNNTLLLLEKKTKEYNQLLERIQKEQEESFKRESEFQFNLFRSRHEREELTVHVRLLEHSLDIATKQQHDISVREADLIQQLAESKSREENLYKKFTEKNDEFERMKEDFSKYKLFVQRTTDDIQELLNVIR
jgi:phage-related minor tail protein